MNWNILVARGEESKRDSLSSGERNGNSLNRNMFHIAGSWEKEERRFNSIEVILDKVAESYTIEGESPVIEKVTHESFYPE